MGIQQNGYPSNHVHDNYTVGLICALPVKLAAATAMLHEIHDNLPRSPLDSNIYTWGRMGSITSLLAVVLRGCMAQHPQL